MRDTASVPRWSLVAMNPFHYQTRYTSHSTRLTNGPFCGCFAVASADHVFIGEAGCLLLDRDPSRATHRPELHLHLKPTTVYNETNDCSSCFRLASVYKVHLLIKLRQASGETTNKHSEGNRITYVCGLSCGLTWFNFNQGCVLNQSLCFKPTPC